MVMHARSGGNIEVMGLMIGKIDGKFRCTCNNCATVIFALKMRLAYVEICLPIIGLKMAKHFFRQRYGCDGQFCLACGGYGDESKRAGTSLRVHGFLYGIS